MAEIDVGKTRQLGTVGWNTERAGRVRQDPGVSSTRHGLRSHGVGSAEELFEGVRHRTPAGAAGEYKGTVDVEKNQRG